MLLTVMCSIMTNNPWVYFWVESDIPLDPFGSGLFKNKMCLCMLVGYSMGLFCINFN